MISTISQIMVKHLWVAYSCNILSDTGLSSLIELKGTVRSLWRYALC